MTVFIFCQFLDIYAIMFPLSIALWRRKEWFGEEDAFKYKEQHILLKVGSYSCNHTRGKMSPWLINSMVQKYDHFVLQYGLLFHSYNMLIEAPDIKCTNSYRQEAAVAERFTLLGRRVGSVYH